MIRTSVIILPITPFSFLFIFSLSDLGTYKYPYLTGSFPSCSLWDFLSASWVSCNFQHILYLTRLASTFDPAVALTPRSGRRDRSHQWTGIGTSGVGDGKDTRNYNRPYAGADSGTCSGMRDGTDSTVWHCLAPAKITPIATSSCLTTSTTTWTTRIFKVQVTMMMMAKRVEMIKWM